MSVKLVTEESLRGICVNDMKDGQVGVILAWKCGKGRFVGRVVQRHGYDQGASLIFIGEPRGISLVTIFATRYEKCRVRLLEAPERIEIVEN